MKVRIIDPTTDPAWAAMVEGTPTDVFSSPSWLAVIRDTYDFDLKAAVGFRNEASLPVAGLPFAEIRDLRGHRAVALPYSDYCDGVVETATDWNALSRELHNHGSSVGMRFLANEFPLGDELFTQIGSAAWHALDLRPGIDVIWSGLASSARRAVRRASSAGLRCEMVTTTEGLRRFFELHLRTRKYKHRLLAQPYGFFEAIWSRFIQTTNGSLLGAYKDDELIAGVLLLKWQDKAYYKFNASSPEYLPLRPNDLLMWSAIQWALGSGCSALDLGLSDLEQTGLLRYKQKWATEERVIRSYESASPDSRTSALNHTRPFLDQLSALFTRDDVPDELTERAGELLYRLFA